MFLWANLINSSPQNRGNLIKCLVVIFVGLFPVAFLVDMLENIPPPMPPSPI